MRDNHWLKKQLEFLLKTYFSDVVISNLIEIKFGREAKYRFGSIKLYPHKYKIKSKVKSRVLDSLTRGVKLISHRVWTRPEKSVITVTSMFAKEDIPVGVVHYTICHELCHYAHGFSSSNKRLFKYPHHGGIVNKELSARGAEHLISAFKKWLKIYRKQILSGKVVI